MTALLLSFWKKKPVGLSEKRSFIGSRYMN